MLRRLVGAPAFILVLSVSPGCTLFLVGGGGTKKGASDSQNKPSPKKAAEEESPASPSSGSD
ncbi:MAG TPA: hypothetical protein VLT62_11280 [Candidatus Methylomirabilis sp.]|nr:hypothetical protein [Candidatus Methylomirabilis sp.]